MKSQEYEAVRENKRMLDKSDKGLYGEFSISPSEINLLPRLAQIAFGARCAYRLLPLASIGSRVHDYCTQILDLVEQLTGHKIIGTEGYYQLDGLLRHAYSELGFKTLPAVDEIVDRPRQAALRVCEAAIDDVCDQYLTRDGAGKIWSASVEAWHAYHDCDTGDEEATNRVAMLNDYNLLADLAKQHEWDDNTLVSRDLFSQYATFQIEKPYPEGSILQLTGINYSLVRKLISSPHDLYKLTPREFEMLVAEILAGLGYEVTLTASTRDGGYDIIAIEYKVVDAMHLIECKRYSDGRKVGIAAVQRLYGVVSDHDASTGIMVTTSWLSKEAEKFVDSHRWRLDRRDYHGLNEWLKLYDKRMIHRAFGK